MTATLSTAPAAARAATPMPAKRESARIGTRGEAPGRDEFGFGFARPLRLQAAGGWQLQRKCACGGAAGLSGTCAECGHRRMLGLQTRAEAPEPADPYEREADRIADEVAAGSARTTLAGVAPRRIQRVPSLGGGDASAVPASVNHVLAGAGSPLEPGLRAEMERQFGHDFSRVRVHTGMAAAHSALEVQAVAYTVGRDIVFAAGRYAAATHEGRRLLAHELTHVVQQAAAEPLRGAAAQAPPAARATVARLQRQPAPEVGPVTVVRLAATDRRIVFETANGAYVYALTRFDMPLGEYTARVSIEGSTVHLDFGSQAASGVRFRFGYRIEPGQVNPVTLLGGQTEVAVSVVDQLTTSAAQSSGTASSGAQSLEARLAAFQRLVKNAGKLRLAENGRALDEWRRFVEQQATPAQVQTQTQAEEVRALLESARAHGLQEQAVAEQWLQTPGPNQRWVQQQQATEHLYTACTGCHALTQAEALDRALAESGVALRTPLEQLAAGGADPGPQPSFGQPGAITHTAQPGVFPATAQAERQLATIRPYLQALGPGGYRVLPPETLGSSAPPRELVADIGRRIVQRQADYREFSRRIDEPDFDYLQLRPIVRDLLPLTDTDVRQAVLNAIDNAQTWETVEAIVVGVASIGLLLLAIFPPTSAIGIGGTLGLAGTLGAQQVYRGYQSFEQGQLYSLGRGAGDVLDPAQQEAADSMMAVGALNMVAGAFGVASSGIGAVRLIRAAAPTGGGLGALQIVEGQAGANVYRVTGFGTRDPHVVVSGPGGQVIREGSLSSFRPAAPATGTPRASAAAPGATGGMVYPTEGGAARVAQPVAVPEPVPVTPPQPVPVPATAPQPTAVPSAGLLSPGALATTGATGLADAATMMAGTDQQPVMPPGLSRSERVRWKECLKLHQRYDVTKAAQAALAESINEITQRGNLTPADIRALCALLMQRLALVERLQDERRDYMELGCDDFDWYQRGTTREQRLRAHQNEEDHVRAQLANLYRLFARYCKE